MTSKNVEEEARRRGEDIPEAEQTTFRSVAALTNYIAPDRPGIQYANKEVLSRTLEFQMLDG